MSILDIINMIFKHKSKIIIIFLTITTVVVTGTLLSEPVYVAKSSFLVKPWKEDGSRPGMNTSNAGSNLMLSQDELVNTEIQILTGRELAEKVINTMKLENIYPDIAKA